MVTKYTMPAKVIFTIDDEHADAEMILKLLKQLKEEGVTKICIKHDYNRGTIIEGFTCGKTEDLTPASDEDAEEGQDPVQGSDSGTPEVGGDPSTTEVVEP